MLPIYNGVVYSMAVGVLLALLVRIWRGMERESQLSAQELLALRRRLLQYPMWLLAVVCLSWMLSGFVFPWVIHIASGPLTADVFGHFMIDFAISGLIAATYSYFGVEAIVLRVLYPRLLVGQLRPCATARDELKQVPLRIRMLQIGAGLIPLGGAALLVLVGPATVDAYGMFRVLVTALIGLGMLGFCFSISLAGRLLKCVSVMSGEKPGHAV